MAIVHFKASPYQSLDALLYWPFCYNNSAQNLSNETRHSVGISHSTGLAMKCESALKPFLFQAIAVLFAEVKADSPFSRSTYFSTRENKQLKGYVVKRFDSPSLLSCGQQCMRYAWCTSTNYKMSSKKDGKGTCELNKHDISIINETTKFYNQQGVTFSMLQKVNSII